MTYQNVLSQFVCRASLENMVTQHYCLYHFSPCEVDLSLTYVLTRSFEGLLYRTNKEEFKKVRVP